MRRKLFIITLTMSALSLLMGCSGASRKQNDAPPQIQDKIQESSEFKPVEIQPILLKDAKAIYPEYALQRGIFGSVWVKILIDTSGNVVDAIIARDSGSKVGFEESALEAARKTVWKPAMSGGKPVAVWVTFKTSFDLR